MRLIALAIAWSLRTRASCSEKQQSKSNTGIMHHPSISMIQQIGMRYFLAYKRRDWRNEEEVRLILPRNKGTTVLLKDPRWLTRVILGMNMSPENESKIREWAKQRQPELTVVRAYLDRGDQEIRLRE
jgi:hypothetical protein